MGQFAEIIEGLAIIFGGISFISRKLSEENGAEFGDVIGKFMSAKDEREIESVPVKSRTYRPKNMDDRVKLIVAMIHKYREHPKIREIAAGIINKKCNGKWCINEKDWINEVSSVYDAVRERVRYVRDVANKDTYVNPVRTLGQFKIADCDDYSVTLGSLLQSIGYPLRVRIIQSLGNDDYNHVYLMVGIPPSNPRYWIPADASMNWRFGKQAPKEIVMKKKDYEV